MSLPYRWFPTGAIVVYTKDLTPDTLVAWEHSVWRVVSIEDRSADLIDGGRDMSIVLRPSSELTVTRSKKEIHLVAGSRSLWNRYTDEHYPVCHHCQEPVPCRDRMVEQFMTQAAERNRRYEIPGVCPACEQPVTERQIRQTWTENLIVPTGGPVTFHLRKRCVSEAMTYDAMWMKAGHMSQLGNQAVS